MSEGAAAAEVRRAVRRVNQADWQATMNRGQNSASAGPSGRVCPAFLPLGYADASTALSIIRQFR
jgi:hypothetical protein